MARAGSRRASSPAGELLRFDFDEPGTLVATDIDGTARADPLVATDIDGTARADPPAAVGDVTLSVAGLYRRIGDALRGAFPGEVWVSGELRKVTESKGHHFLELADRQLPAPAGQAESPAGQQLPAPAGQAERPAPGSKEATLEIACWAREWPPIARELAGAGVDLAPGLVVRVRGRVSIWEGGGRLRFSMTALDVEALVGGIATAKRGLLATLEQEGLLQANRGIARPLVPLRIGVVTSPNSEAHRDFVGQLERSGFAFEIMLAGTLVQGPEAAAQIAAALGSLARFDPDVVVVVRGGGARGDLAAFDSEIVARAIAAAPYPVWTGIGHTGDRSVADEVAQRALVTPTQCGEAVVADVAAYLDTVDRCAQRIARRVHSGLDEARRHVLYQGAATKASTNRLLERRTQALRSAQHHAAHQAIVAIERSRSQLVGRAHRIAAPAEGLLVSRTQQIRHRRELLAIFDPRRQLERGWSLTRDSRGKILRSVHGVDRGDELVTTLADGKVTGKVTGTVVEIDQIEKAAP